MNDNNNLRAPLDWLTQTPIAHRGLHSNDSRVPENSLCAFREAVKNNYPIELDVQITADNQIVVFHDENLERMCGHDALVQNLTIGQLQDFRLLESEERIPLLEDVLNAVKGQVPLLIEIKDQKGNARIQKILFEKIRYYKGDLAIQSFNPFLLKWFVQHAPTIPRGQLSGDFKNEKINFFIKKLLQHFILNFISKPHFIGYDIQAMPNKTVRNVRKKGLIVLCWTIKQDTPYKHLLPYYDNIIFEGFKA